MKTKKNFLKKLTAGILGFVMTLGVGAAGYAASASETKAADVTVVRQGSSALSTTETEIAGDSNVKIKTSDANSYSSPARFYANTTITIKSYNSCTLKSITYNASSTGNYVDYAKNATVSPNATPTVSDKAVTWTMPSDTTQFTIKPTAQTRWNSISVTYTSSGGGTVIPVSSVSLNKTTASLTVGDTEVLTPTVNPSNATDKTVSWTTSDSSVATVNNGTVTAIAAGSATITASAGGKTATCAVTVTAGGGGSSAEYEIVTSGSSLTAGMEFIIAGYSASSYRLGKDLNSGHIKMNTVTSASTVPSSAPASGSKITTSEADVFTLAGSSNAWQIVRSGTYLQFTGTSNGNDSFTSSSTSNDTKFTISFNSAAVQILSNTRSNRYLKYNTGTGDLRNGGSTYGVDIYMYAKATPEQKYSVTNSLTNASSNGATGAQAASNKNDYVATLSPASGYNGVTLDSVKVGETTLSSSDYTWSSNQLTIPSSKINGNITITAHGTKSTYTVDASGTGVTFSSKPNATYLTQYQITFSVNEGYIAPTTATAKVGSTNITGVTVSGNTITVPAAGVTGNLTITADATLKTYTLSISGLQNIDFDQETGSSLEHGKTFAGTLTPVTGYTLDGATITVTMGDEDITSDVLADDYIQIDEVTGDIVITGSGVKVQDPVIDIDNDEFRIEENATATLTVEYSLATLTSASAVLDTGKDVVTFGTLNPSTGKITLTPKAKGEGYYTLTVNYVNTNTSASASKDFDVYVEVYGDELTGISLSSESGNYYLGDNVAHPTVTAHYSLTGDRTVTASWDDSAYDKYHTGSYELIASYNGETATYTANVAAKSYTTKGEDTHVYSYDKVTSSQTDWRGKYLIVYETDSLAMDGSLETLDAPSNTKSVTISDNKIATDVDGLIGGNAIYFTVDYKGTSTSIYSLMSASGKYISGTTTSAKAANGIKQAENPDNYEITFSGTELQSKSSDQQMAMKYNKANDQTRFRFYKSGQEAVALYKWTDHMTPGQDIPSDERHAIRIGNVSCSKSPLIAGDTLDVSDFSIQVQFDTGNNFVDNLVPTDVSPTTIAVGAHDYTVSYTGGYTGETLVQKTISLTGQAAPVLDSIYVTKDNPCDDDFTKNDTFTHNGIHVWAKYTDSTLYSDIEVTDVATITPPDMTTDGTKTVNVSYTEGDNTETTSYTITVNKIHTTELTLTMKDSGLNEVLPKEDGFYEIEPGSNYTLSFVGNGDYNSVTVTGGTANTTVVNNQTLSSTANSNEEVTFTATCDQASLPIKVRVIASKTISLDAFSTENQGADAEVVDDTSGSFSGYIGNSVSIQIGTKNYSNPVIDDSELPSGLTLTGSFNSGIYSGEISATVAVSGTYNLYVKESGGSDSQAISLTFSVVQDAISKIEITHEPNKVSYTLGETFDSTGLEVTATYASGSPRVLNSSEYSFDPPVMTKGSHTVTVTLNGSTTIKDTFDITVSIPELNIVTEGKKTVPDPEHNVPGTTPIVVESPSWTGLGKNDRVAKNSTLKNDAKFASYASSITVSFEGKALSSNKGSLFDFKLEATSNGAVVDKYTVYYAPINEDGTGYYKTTDDYETISLTITGISESDKIDGYIFTACDKLNGATGSANGNLDHQNESASYKGFVPGTKEVPVYSNNVVTDEVYDFVMAYGGSNLTAANWDTIFTSEEYQAVVNAGKKGLFTNGVVSGSDDDGTKTSWKEFADFITKYDQILAMNSGLENYLERDKLNLSAFINASIGFQFTGLEMKKFEFVFTGEWTTEEEVSSYGFMISKNLDALNACIESRNTTGSGITTFVPEDDEAKCSAGVKTTSADTVYYAVFFYEDANGIHYSLVLEISINGYLQSDQFDINSITDPYAKAAIQAWIASLEK